MTTTTRAMYAITLQDTELGTALGARVVGPKPTVVISGIFTSPDAFADAILATGAHYSRYDLIGRLDDLLFSPRLRREPNLPEDGVLYASVGKHREDATDFTPLADVRAPCFHAMAAERGTYVTIVKGCGHESTYSTAMGAKVGDEVPCFTYCGVRYGTTPIVAIHD